MSTSWTAEDDDLNYYHEGYRDVHEPIVINLESEEILRIVAGETHADGNYELHYI